MTPARRIEDFCVFFFRNGQLSAYAIVVAFIRDSDAVHLGRTPENYTFSSSWMAVAHDRKSIQRRPSQIDSMRATNPADVVFLKGFGFTC
jgi:hypothetical protein